jgi:MFS family permease
MSLAAVVVLVAAGFLSSLTLEWDSDVPWHLAGGDWMLRHGKVLDYDPFSIPEGPNGSADRSRPPQQWVNVHWLFELLTAWAHRQAGFAALSVLKAVVAGCLMLAFALALRRRVGPAWMILCGLAMFALVYTRIRVRPEIFTLVFMLLAMALLESVRQGGRLARLWWLTPLMLAWANMHGLFVIGVGIMWAAIGGAWLDRLLRRETSSRLASQAAMAPVAAATVACLVTPWPLETVGHFLTLFSRISGQEYFYTYGVSELAPTYEALGSYTFVIILLAAVAALMMLNRRRVPVAQVAWLAAMVAVAAMARRNVALLGPVIGYLAAVHGSDLLARLHSRWGRMGAMALPSAAVVAAGALLLTAGAMIGWLPRNLSLPHRFGVGMQDDAYPLKAAEFLRNLDVPGDVLCDNFGDASSFIYFGNRLLPSPKRLVFMDGRLEVHSAARFVANSQLRGQMQTARGAASMTMPPSVRFVVVSHSSRDALGSLMGAPSQFRLIYVEPSAAVFAYLGNGMRDELSRLTPNLGDYDRPLLPPGVVDGRAERAGSFWDRNPPNPDYQLGALLLTLGRREDVTAKAPPASALQQECLLLASRRLHSAMRRGEYDAPVVAGLLAQACQQRELAAASDYGQGLPVEINFARALRLYAELPLDDLRDPNLRMFAEQRVEALVRARQLDAAADAVAALLAALPPAQRVNPPMEYVSLRDVVAEGLAKARARYQTSELPAAPLMTRAKALAGPEFGLVNQAIAELRAAPARTAANQLLLGDLLLGKGDVAAARAIYQGIAADDAGAQALRLRLALCDWAAGDLFAASGALAELSRQSRDLTVRYYHAALLEELGIYSQAYAALRDADVDSAPIGAALNAERLKRRLAARLQPSP